MTPSSLPWFAAHELRLAWRDFARAITGGRKSHGIISALVLLAVWLGAHWLANEFIAPWRTAGIVADPPTLLVLSGMGLVLFLALLSQSLGAVTRAFYARADFDLLLSSPAPIEKVFSVRALATGAGSAALACFIASPAIDMAAWNLGPQWLCAYGVIIALAALATAAALTLTLLLFRIFGTARTRWIAQILGGIVGAGFAIGIQGAAIWSYGSTTRAAALLWSGLFAHAPDTQSPVWLLARAMMGEPTPLVVVLLASALLLILSVHLCARRFPALVGRIGAQTEKTARSARTGTIRQRSQRAALRHKEWRLMRRSPWLISESLMQVLYLIPPALMLWINFGSAGIAIAIVPVLVMAGGQLSGGLAWLTVSAEDAPDLVATAPVTTSTVIIAKIEAVLVAVGTIMAPLLLVLATALPWAALVTAGFLVVAAASATLIQVWFRAPAKRSLFRRRHAASRIATLCEALGSMMWAGTAALVTAGTQLFIITAVLAILVLGIARLFAPRTRTHSRTGSRSSRPA